MPDKTINNLGVNSEAPKNCCDGMTPPVREITLTDKLNKKLAMSLLQRMNNPSDSQIQRLVQSATEDTQEVKFEEYSSHNPKEDNNFE